MAQAALVLQELEGEHGNLQGEVSCQQDVEDGRIGGGRARGSQRHDLGACKAGSGPSCGQGAGHLRAGVSLGERWGRLGGIKCLPRHGDRVTM